MGYWYLYCGPYSLRLQSKAKLCTCAYRPDFCSNFVVLYKRLNVRLYRRVNVKGHGSECCFFGRNLSLARVTFFFLNKLS